MVNENNNETPEDLPDFEGDNSDFSEFDTGKKSASFGEAIRNNPLIKILLVGVALAAVIGGIVFFGGEKEKPPQSFVTKGSDLKEAPGTKELTPAMQEAMEISNEQKVQEAINTGGSVLPTPIEPPKTFLPVPEETSTNEDPLQRWRQMQEERLRIQREQEELAAQASRSGMNDPAVQQSVKDLSAAMSAKMMEIVNVEQNPVPVKYMKVYSGEVGSGQGGSFSGQAAGGQPGVSSGNAAGSSGIAGQPPEPIEIIIAAGSIVYAQLLNEANSDVEGPIVALIAQGPFSGSRALGSFSRKEELLVLQFNTLVTKDGYSVPIQSFAMDPDTTLVGMATDVDHRYWSRIILPAAASFVQGVGEAIGEKGTTSVTVNNSSGTTTSQDNSEIDTEQELAKGAEKAFEKLGDIFDDEAEDEEPLVIVKAGTPMGLLFMQSVTKQQVDAARYGVGMTAAGAGQPQQPQSNSLLGMLGAGMVGNQQMAPYGQGAYYSQPPVQQGYPGVPPALIQALQQQQGLMNANQYVPQGQATTTTGTP